MERKSHVLLDTVRRTILLTDLKTSQFVCKCIVKNNVITLLLDDDNRIILATNPNLDLCQREYINANYVDVSVIYILKYFKISVSLL